MNDKYHKKREGEEGGEREKASRVKQRTFEERTDPNRSKMSTGHRDRRVHCCRLHRSSMTSDRSLRPMNHHGHSARTWLHRDDAKRSTARAATTCDVPTALTFFASFSIVSYGSAYRSQCRSPWPGRSPPR